MNVTGYGINEGELAVSELKEILSSLEALYSGENQSYQNARGVFHISVAADEMDTNQDLLHQAEQKTIAAVTALIGSTTKNNEIADETIQLTQMLAKNIRA